MKERNKWERRVKMALIFSHLVFILAMTDLWRFKTIGNNLLHPYSVFFIALASGGLFVVALVAKCTAKKPR